MAVTYGAVRVLESVSSILLLIGVAFFLALGLEPAASWFVNRKLPRWAATTLVFVIFLALLGAFVAAAIPPLTQQAGELINQAPHYIQQAQDHSSAIGRLNERLHLQQRITDAFNSSGGSIVADAVSAGAAVFGFLADTLIVIVLTVYFLIDMPRIRTSLYRLVPHTRRPRAILIGDEAWVWGFGVGIADRMRRSCGMGPGTAAGAGALVASLIGRHRGLGVVGGRVSVPA